VAGSCEHDYPPSTSIKGEDSLTSKATISFSMWTPLHELNFVEGGYMLPGDSYWLVVLNSSIVELTCYSVC
jgi:hypothetical protein